MKPLIVFFDGPCVLCNKWVQWLCRQDTQDCLRFANFQHQVYLKFAEERNLPTSPHSVIVWDQEMAYYIEAEALFQLFKKLKRPWSFLTIFRYLPNFLSNGLYRLVARKRYQWFGQLNQCPLPPNEWRHKYL